MAEPAGALETKSGPLIYRLGMDGATPLPAMEIEGLENAFNVDYDRAGRPVPRPGSTFQARVGWGQVIGLSQHYFEVGGRPPKPVAMVVDAFPHVHALVDPHVTGGVGEEEPAAVHDVGFVPDWRTHGQVIIPFVARKTDRFRFQSFLNRLYIAGGTLDHRVWFYDYDLAIFEPIMEVKGVAVVAVGNRLFVGGDPLAPNLVYPSNPNEPETFQTQLAMQIGTRNDAIEVLLEHQGLVIVLKANSSHWLLPGAIELGDFQTEKISNVHGVAGRLAACEGSDGWVYWLSDVDGPVRWRRGMGEVDTSFADDMRPIFDVMLKGPLDQAIVEDDPERGCIRFEVPTAGCATPNWLASYFYRHPKGRWSHGASTTDSRVAAHIRDVPDKLHVRIGGPLYTALASMPDPLLGGYAMFGGTERGSIYFWKRYSQDFQRGYDECARDFICMLRPGPLELALMRQRAMISALILDVQAGFNWLLRLLAELDYRDDWQMITEEEHGVGEGGLEGELPFILDADRPLDRLHHSWHLVLTNGWDKLLAKVIRLELQWFPERPLCPIGYEFETAPNMSGILEIHQHEPIPFPPQEEACDDGPYCPPIGDPDLPPLSVA